MSPRKHACAAMALGILVMLGCDASTRLSPAELGTYEYIKPYLERIATAQRNAIRSSDAWNNAEEQIRNAEEAYNIAPESEKGRHARAVTSGRRRLERAQKGYWSALDGLADATRETAFTERTLIYPHSMSELMNAYEAFTDLEGRINAEKMLEEDQRLLLGHARALIEARDATLAVWKSRKPDYSHVKGSTNLNIQINGMPIKLDVIDGEFKLSWSGNIGPIKTTFDTGGVRGSIRTLIVQDHRRPQYFAVGGRPLRIELPACTLETSGSVMIITAK